METAFKYFEANDIIPTTSQLVEKYEERLNGSVPRKPEPEPKKKETKPKEPDLFNVFDEFVFECGEKNAWTKATFKKKLNTPRKPKGDRKDYDDDDLVGIKNSTIDKKLGYLKWFLKWATDKGYNSNVAYKTFKPNLKATQKKVIYLSKDELKTILNFELKGDTLYLEPVRDIFMFCCFSSLRYSDASSLKWNDVKDDHIEVTTVKTADSLSIEINDMMGRILEKHRAVPDKRNNLVFPYYTNQAMKPYIDIVDSIKASEMSKMNFMD